MRFKKGDKVRCIDAIDAGPTIKEGKEYTIGHVFVGVDMVHLEGLDEAYLAIRFELVKEEGAKKEVEEMSKFKKGDKVKCIEATGIYLKLGKEYTVKDVEVIYGIPMFLLEGIDGGIDGAYDADLFELVKPKEKLPKFKNGDKVFIRNGPINAGIYIGYHPTKKDSHVVCVGDGGYYDSFHEGQLSTEEEVIKSKLQTSIEQVLDYAKKLGW